MKMKFLLSAIIATSAYSSATVAAPIILEGDYVRTAVSDDGTLGYGGSSDPGIIHDVTGTRTWPVDDYLTPGTPWEGFYVAANEFGTRGNNNDGGNSIATTSLTDTSGTSGYDNSVNWQGLFGDYFTLEIDTFFNDEDESISMITTLIALQDLTDVSFLRTLDPDPDVYTYNSYDTVNGRGDAAKGVSASDWVHSQGASTGLTIGLYSDSDTTHNTGVSADWSTDANFYLSGANDGNGDYTLGLAFDLGSLLENESVSFSYSYIMGEDLSSVDLPNDDVVSVSTPAPFALFAGGLLGLALTRRKKA